MDNLKEIFDNENNKNKNKNKILGFLTVILFAISFISLGFDSWDIADKITEQKFNKNKVIYTNTIDEYIANKEYSEAYALISNLPNDRGDFHNILYYYNEVKELVSTAFEGETAGYDIKSAVFDFYDELYYRKENGPISNFYFEIEEDMDRYLLAYNVLSNEDLKVLKEGIGYEK